MTQLKWNTPSGTVANLSVGDEINQQIIAYNPVDNADTITYRVIDGALPPGVTMTPAGKIQGLSLSPGQYTTRYDYQFIVRATSGLDALAAPDRAFNIIINNNVNNELAWITTGGDLGTVPNGNFYQLPLQVVSPPGETITYSFVSGELPPGMQIVASGFLQGVPSLTNSVATDQSVTFKFTVRARTSANRVIDQAFILTVTNVYAPIIEPTNSLLGSFFDGTHYSQKLSVTELNPNVNVTWSNIGILPPGLTLDTNTGVISGYLQRAILSGEFGPSGYDGSATVNNTFSVAGVSNYGVYQIVTPGPVQTATEMIPGQRYRISSIGTTNFGLYGAPLNTVDTVFTANAAGSGSGIVYFDPTDFMPIGAPNSDIGTIFVANTQVHTPTGSGTVSLYNALISNNINGTTTVSNGLISTDLEYQIQSAGTTDFVSIGSTSNTIGTVFKPIANSFPGLGGVGTGILSQYIPQGSVSQEYDHSPYDFNQLGLSASYSFLIQAFDGANYDLQSYTISVISRGAFTSDNSIVTVDISGITVDSSNIYAPIMQNVTNGTVLPAGRSGAQYSFKFTGFDFQYDTLIYSTSGTTGAFDASVPGIDDGFDYGGDDDAHLGGVGFDSYDGNSAGNLPGLTLDATNGWMYGTITPGQIEALKQYQFSVLVTKYRDGNPYSSRTAFVTLPVYTDSRNNIECTTDPDLGTIDNGSVSELVITAKGGNRALNYFLVDQAGVGIRLPQGLRLGQSGEISGRTTFESFTLDNYTTTFDQQTTTVDRTYQFTVMVDDAVYDQYGNTVTPATSSNTRQFTLRINVIDQKPYENLYLRALPNNSQLQHFYDIVNDPSIFSDDVIYRATDPWFGRAQNIDLLFLPGLNPVDLANYQDSMIHNHYTKRYDFGEIKSAVVLNPDYSVKYEVVYVEISDPELNSAGNGPPLEIDLNGVIVNPYIDINGNEYKTVYPNTSQNMISRLGNGIGYYDQSSLPNWMTSNQPSNNGATFNPPLGYTRAVVLAYVKSGQSKKIAYRLRDRLTDFSGIEFAVDRYLLDDYYVSNFNTATQRYRISRETTFDALINKNVGVIVGGVTYAVTVPFSQINGRTVSYINQAGGIDGITNFVDGETLVFAQQENFLDPGPYQGWVNYTDAYIGDNILTNTVEGYDSEGYDLYSIIPGYLEKTSSTNSFISDGTTRVYTLSQSVGNPAQFTVRIGTILQDPATYTVSGTVLTFAQAPFLGSSIEVDFVVNQRGGIWKINIVNSIVNLTPVQEILPNQSVRVNYGRTFGASVLLYTGPFGGAQTVPAYVSVKFDPGAVAVRTTFNGDGTRFFSYRDSYYTPGSNDKYVKFPQYGVFN